MERGKRLADELEANETAFTAEKSVMGTIRTRITESLVKQMFGWRQDA
jgi:hypothetical protein